MSSKSSVPQAANFVSQVMMYPLTSRHVACSKVTNQSPVVIVEEETRCADIVLVALTGVCELLSLLNEAVGIGLEAELLVCGSITTCDLMRVFLSNLAGFNAIGLFGRADLVSLVPGIQNACKIIGTCVGLIESQTPSDADDLTLKTVRRSLSHRIISKRKNPKIYKVTYKVLYNSLILKHSHITINQRVHGSSP